MGDGVAYQAGPRVALNRVMTVWRVAVRIATSSRASLLSTATLGPVRSFTLIANSSQNKLSSASSTTTPILAANSFFERVRGQHDNWPPPNCWTETTDLRHASLQMSWEWPGISGKPPQRTASCDRSSSGSNLNWTSKRLTQACSKMNWKIRTAVTQQVRNSIKSPQSPTPHPSSIIHYPLSIIHHPSSITVIHSLPSPLPLH
jgi:hypothetical protein